MRADRLGAIILAAGGSSRMGRPKQLLPFQGRSLLRGAIENTRSAGCDPVVVVLGADADGLAGEIAGTDAQVVVNSDWPAGIGASIRCAIAAITSMPRAPDAVLILLADQPRVTSETLRKLIAAYRESGKAVCAASYAGTIGPPVIVSRQYFADLSALPPDRGAKQLWIAHPESLATVALPEAADDIDTLDDFQRLCGHA